MVCKPINQINFKLEEMYDAIVWVIMTVRQASVFDANNFCHHISQLTQLMSGNIPHPERFDQMIHIEQGEESLPHIISNSREESLQQVSQVPTTLMISSRICPNKIYASTVKI